MKQGNQQQQQANGEPETVVLLRSIDQSLRKLTQALTPELVCDETGKTTTSVHLRVSSKQANCYSPQ